MSNLISFPCSLSGDTLIQNYWAYKIILNTSMMACFVFVTRSLSNPQFVRSFNKLRSVSMPNKFRDRSQEIDEGKLFIFPMKFLCSCLPVSHECCNCSSWEPSIISLGHVIVSSVYAHFGAEDKVGRNGAKSCKLILFKSYLHWQSKISRCENKRNKYINGYGLFK